MTVRMRFLYLFCACVFFVPAAAADEFRFGYSDLKPFIWTEKATVKGIYADVLKEALEKRMGIRIRYRALPVKRLMHYVETNELDGFIEVSTPERLRYCRVGRVPIAMGLVGAFTYKEHPRLQSLADKDTLFELKGNTILTYRGDDWAKDHLSGFDVDSDASDLESALRKLKAKRGDLILQAEQVAGYNIRELNLEKNIVQISNISLNPILYQLLVSQKSQFTEILPRLDRVLTAMLNDGTIKEIYDTYRRQAAVEQVVSTRKPKIKFVHYATGVLPGALDEIAEAFNLNHAEFRLKPIHMDMESYKQAVKVMLVGGNPADMLMTWAGYRTQYLVDSGFIEPIDEIWKSADMDNRFTVSTARGMTYNGHKYGVPLTHHIVVLFYNKSIFTANKIAVPKTWDAFVKTCETLKSKGITPIALGSKERWPAQSWFDYLLVRTAGPDYRKRLMAGGASFTDPQVKEVFRLWKEMMDQGFFNTDCNRIDYDDASRRVFEGKAAMTLNGTWTVGDFENLLKWKAGRDFDFFVFPRMDSNVPDVLVGVMDIILHTRAGKSKAASQALAYISEKESQMTFSRKSGALSPNTNIPASFYPPLLQKISETVRQTPREVFGYDLSTPPSVAEIGLNSFKAFLENPDQYETILNETEKKIRQALKADGRM